MSRPSQADPSIRASCSELPRGERDVVVVGAGLGGLTAAIAAARRGCRVVVVERLSRAGGLCGSFELDGREFARACNEFGCGVAEAFEALGVPVAFQPSRARIFFDEDPIGLPPKLGDAGAFARHARGLFDLVRGLRAGDAPYLGELAERHVRDRWVTDLLGFLAFASATPLERIRVEDVRALVKERYGWHRPVKPVGGPGAVVRGLVRRAGELGVEILLDTACEGVARERRGFVVATSRGALRCREVISSAPRWDAYPEASWPGMSYALLLLAVSADLRFPGDVHTVHHVPRDVPAWMGALRDGRLPDRFGFLLTRQIVPRAPREQALVGFFPAPMGVAELRDEERRQVEERVTTRGDRMIPGLASSIRYLRVVSPGEFARLHGVSSCAFARLPPAGFKKPDPLDPRTGIHHVGVSVGPPGGDGAASVFCGRRVGEAVAGRLA